MIWTDDILFLHVPKTGGISTTRFLLTNLEGRVQYTANHPVDEAPDAEYHEGPRHETLVQAEAFHSPRGRSVGDFAAVFAVMRNPYDLEVSRYHYLRKGHDVDRGRAQDLAIDDDFEKYLAEAPFFGSFPPRLDRYFRIGDYLPKNLHVLRFERLSTDLAEKLSDFLVEEPVPLPHLNKSDHDDYWRYYDKRCEQLCYQRHRWFFDMSFYQRRYDFAGKDPVVAE